MYSFNNKDLLVLKENYMYFPFYGKDFFLAYAKNRINFTKKIQVNNSTTNDLYFSKVIELILLKKINYKFSNKLSNIISDYKININANMKPKNILAYKSLNLKKNTIINTNDLLDFLIINSINKFEVSKRLYCTYSKSLKKIGYKFKSIDLYKKLSILLIIGYMQNSNNRYLSTLLKVNDLISSTELSLEKKHHNELIIIFSLEEIFIKNLFKKHKIIK
jgi:hypothetical protein